MLRPAEMVRLTVGVHAVGRDEMIATLHEAGAVELQSVADEESLRQLVTSCHRSQAVPDIASARSRIERTVEVLAVFVPEKNAVVALFSRPPDNKISFPVTNAASALKEAARFSEITDSILALHARDISIAERLGRMDEEEEMLSLLLPFGIEPGRLGGAGFLEVRAGIVPTGECADIDAHLREEMPELAVPFLLCGVGDRPATVVIITHPDASADADRVLRALAFREFTLETAEGTALAGIASIQNERDQLRQEQNKIHVSLKELAQTHLTLLEAMAEELGVMRDREDARPLFGETGSLIVMQGWAKKCDMPRIRELCDRSTGSLSFCTTEPATGAVPSAFDHPHWLAPYGFLTAMFGMPAYGRIDPTLFLAPVLILTFGLMLGDAGYGILLFLIAALLLRGAGHTPGTTHDLAIVLCACGVAGAVFGILMGSFFGNLAPFFGITLPFTVIEPLNDPLSLLILALGIGIVHLNLGFVIAASEHLRCGERRKMLYSEGTWFLLQPCAAVLILSFFGWATFSSLITTVAWAGAVVAIIGILRDNGPLGFFSLTGYLGDWLSYARILALALATSGIAMMINILSGMIAGIGPFFLIVGIIFGIGGHAANLVLQCLGGFIHALRLQYVEFFGRFFDAGGRAFSPFIARRIHTRPQEERDGS
ncbi:V-type ATP synthase subunit I [Methanogenium marinum]|uniref:A-type ATP synthase subunit I n=1 Tax=Methanogenium marinum TaxID=348610 RepID=A0A9Q4KUQ1_9EURY|nr:V-type ATP synthase subunit I [Methanogenium marinum]MDE4907620.1 V-type ATP synthase subunit I [Methanogenium marinum]